VKASEDDSRQRLLVGVRARQDEIARAVLGRINAIGPRSDPDLEYQDGLRRATDAAVEHTVGALERAPGAAPPAPSLVLAQAELAARRRVPLETVLRRYLAGHSLLGDFIVEEDERIGVSPGVLRWVLRGLAATTDQVIADISAAYLREASSVRPRSSGQRQAEAVTRLLDGELIDPATLHYDLGAWHLALAVRGSEEDVVVESISRAFDASKLVVPREDHTIHVWLGTRHRLDPVVVQQVAGRSLAEKTWVGIGEPATGLTGWRLSHEQAEVALAVAIRRSEISTRYADVALLASAIRDDLLTTSLRQIYLAPLGGGNGGVLRDTLSAYLSKRRNVTSAAAALSVDRRTVANRLRIAEQRIGSSLDGCLGHLEIALQLDRLDRN
jgi:hypothetical protein